MRKAKGDETIGDATAADLVACLAVCEAGDKTGVFVRRRKGEIQSMRPVENHGAYVDGEDGVFASRVRRRLRKLIADVAAEAASDAG